jgi:hypothetical protein
MNILISIYRFFDNPFFVIVGGISVLLIVINALINFFCWTLGIWPILRRFGYGRWFRKIAIVAGNEEYTTLKGDLVDSGIFKEKNIFQITSQSLSKVKDNDLLLVHYQSFNENQIIEMLSYKKSKAGMIFYYPGFSHSTNSIPKDILDKINNNQNTTIVNFRGRLLSDILVTLLTTSYGKR